MAEKFSSYFYRNPAALKKLEAQLRQELAEFTPVQNEPEAVLQEIQRLRDRVAANTAALNNDS